MYRGHFHLRGRVQYQADQLNTTRLSEPPFAPDQFVPTDANISSFFRERARLMRLAWDLSRCLNRPETVFTLWGVSLSTTNFANSPMCVLGIQCSLYRHHECLPRQAIPATLRLNVLRLGSQYFLRRPAHRALLRKRRA